MNSAAVALGIALEFVDDGLEIGDCHVGRAYLLDQSQEGRLVNVGPRADGDRIAGQKERKPVVRHGWRFRRGASMV
jgi:hypothetical protein